MVNYKELVEFIVKYLVTQPDAVSVESGEEENGTKVMIRVAHEDVGRIIGKRGATINAIRHGVGCDAPRYVCGVYLIVS